MNRWKLLHTYNLLVQSGAAAPLLCPDSANELVPIIDPDIEEPIPALYCSVCDTVTKPGLDLWDQIKAVVLEHFDAGYLA